jgi:hypothetical protein
MTSKKNLKNLEKEEEEEKVS